MGEKKQEKLWGLLGRSAAGTGKRRRSFADAAQQLLDLEEPAPAETPESTARYRTGCTLADLQPNECGTIRFLIGPARSRLRLLEMGLTPGQHIRVMRVAAFGGPMDILVRGYQLSLRREEAAGIWLGEEDDEEPGRRETTSE